jgi:cobalt-zinc-cadmium efflux system membrane fusion protein
MWTTTFRSAVAVMMAAGMMAGSGWLTQRATGDEPGPELVPGEVDAVLLSKRDVDVLHLRMTEVRARKTPRGRVVNLSGSLALIPERLQRVRAYVAAEVVELGKFVPGDKVKANDLLAVVMSKDLATKKADLIDAIVQLRLAQAVLARAEKAADSVPEVFILKARREVEAAKSAVNRAVNTLRAWHISDEELKALQKLAEDLAAGKAKRDPEAEKNWARRELRAAQDGILIEKNVNLHEFVDSPTALFTIADTSRLKVIVAAPEDEVPSLNALTKEQRRWIIRVPGYREVRIEGQIDQINYLLDPKQHTCVVDGTVPNADGRLRAGQFITASVTVPHPLQELIVPASALVQADFNTVVFIQPDPSKHVYVQRHADIVRRGSDTAHVRFSWKRGERIVTSGAVELKAVLDDLLASR